MWGNFFLTKQKASSGVFEESEIVEPKALDLLSGYAQSKWVAEQCVLRAAKLVTCYRVGSVVQPSRLDQSVTSRNRSARNGVNEMRPSTLSSHLGDASCKRFGDHHDEELRNLLCVCFFFLLTFVFFFVRNRDSDHQAANVPFDQHQASSC